MEVCLENVQCLLVRGKGEIQGLTGIIAINVLLLLIL